MCACHSTKPCRNGTKLKWYGKVSDQSEREFTKCAKFVKENEMEREFSVRIKLSKIRVYLSSLFSFPEVPQNFAVLNTRKENIPYLRVPCIILYSNLPCFLSNRQVQQFPALRKDPGTTQKGCYCTITPNLVKEASMQVVYILFDFVMSKG